MIFVKEESVREGSFRIIGSLNVTFKEIKVTKRAMMNKIRKETELAFSSSFKASLVILRIPFIFISKVIKIFRSPAGAFQSIEGKRLCSRR